MVEEARIHRLKYKGGGPVPPVAHRPEAELNSSPITESQLGWLAKAEREGRAMRRPSTRTCCSSRMGSLERLTSEKTETHGDARSRWPHGAKTSPSAFGVPRLKFELIGLDDAEQAALERETAEFNRCCKVLGWRP